MKAREGDLIETQHGLIFDVKGLVHPRTEIIAFIRYFPDISGEREKDSVRYEKVYSLEERFDLLASKFPQYLRYDSVIDEKLCKVPIQDIEKIYDPIKKLEEMSSSEDLDPLEQKVLNLAKLLRTNAGLALNSIGVSGSVLADLHTPSSDIDIIVYGSENCRKAYLAIEAMLKDSSLTIKPYTRRELQDLFAFRSKDTIVSFEDFVRTESRKLLQGKFDGADYFLRFVKDWNEVEEQYGDVTFKNLGYTRIKTRVIDTSESIFTPCTYVVEETKPLAGLKDVAIRKIVSFRGRFCDQARKGETVVAQGKIEQVSDNRSHDQHFRLLIGNQPSDYIILG
jgi:predicted nucleotidyltransferase